VYITTLYRWGAPQIRFNINDVSRIIPGSCACGSTLKRLDRIFGRNDTMVKLRGVNVFPEAVGAVVVADRRTNGEYVCIVERTGAEGREEMTVMIEVPGESVDRTQVAREFEQRFKEVLGVRVAVDAVPRGATDRYTGTSQSSKIKRLVDKR
jgi:phenylacetate-CoA ligase